jgi:hypothetical protein
MSSDHSSKGSGKRSIMGALFGRKQGRQSVDVSFPLNVSFAVCFVRVRNFDDDCSLTLFGLMSSFHTCSIPLPYHFHHDFVQTEQKKSPTLYWFCLCRKPPALKIVHTFFVLVNSR